MGFVYLLLSVDPYGEENHKVGISKNDPKKRVKQLQTGNSNIIQLLQVYESKEYKRVEQILHGRYHQYRTLSGNEWFCLPNEIVLSFIDECKKADETIGFLKEHNHFFK